MASINNTVTVTLLPEGQAAQRDNMNICAVFTSEQGVLSTYERYRAYKSVADVEADFGTSAKITAHANVFFSQTPNAVNAGGDFVAAYWRGASETVEATSGTLTGTQLSESTVVSALQGISDGSFNITIDGGSEIEATAIDFRTVTSFDDIVTVLDGEITGATVSEDDQKIVITSDTTGASSTVTLMSEGTVGTFIGDILTLSQGSGAVIVDGADQEVLTPETKVEALSTVKAEINFKGAVFIDNPTDVESKEIATWAQANDTLSYDVFDSDDNLDIDPTNVVWDIKLSSLTNYRMLYRKDGDRKFATGYMSRAHTVNFNAENSANTMNLKSVAGTTAEDLSQTTINKCKAVGLDCYVTQKNVATILMSGANDFTDNRYNLIAFVDAVQTDMFNLLKATATKIPQTTKGVQQLVSQGEKTTKGFVRAGVFAAGTWSSPDTFGNIDTFNASIEKQGFYWLAGSLADQPQSDRQARKSPVLQCAVKNAGAIHSVDIIINFNL